MSINIFKKKEKRTGPITPKYNGVIPPMPPIKVPKEDNPKGRPTPPSNPFKGKLDPPFDASIANKESSRIVDEKEKELEDLIWDEVVKAIKNGDKNVHLNISNRRTYYEKTFFEQKAHEIIEKLDKRTYPALENIGHRFVKNNYVFEVTNARVPSFYVDKDDENKKLHPYDKGDLSFIRDFIIDIYWYDDALTNPLYKYSNCRYRVREKIDDNEYFYNNYIEKEIHTKEQIIAEEAGECQVTS